MAQVDVKKLENEWIPFSSIVIPVSDRLYYIQNRGPNIMLACEGNSMPIKNDGLMVKPNQVLKYKVGSQNLYLKSESGCLANVSDEA